MSTNYLPPKRPLGWVDVLLVVTATSLALTGLLVLFGVIPVHGG